MKVWEQTFTKTQSKFCEAYAYFIANTMIHSASGFNYR